MDARGDLSASTCILFLRVQSKLQKGALIISLYWPQLDTHLVAQGCHLTFLTWSTKVSVIRGNVFSQTLSFGRRLVSLSTFDLSWDIASVPCLPTLSFYLLTLVVTGGLLSRVLDFGTDFVLLCCVTNCQYVERRLFPFRQIIGQKGFLLITCGTLSRHFNFKFPHRSQNNGAYVSAKTSGKSKLDWRINFQISCPLYSPIRVYLRPHQNMLLNLYYQSQQRQTMLRKNSCQSLGLQYTQTCTALTVITR